MAGVSHGEYQALFEKLVKANRLFEERDALSRQKLTFLQHRCQEYAGIIKAQQSARRLFEQDVDKLTQAAGLLEQREKDVDAKNKQLREDNAALSAALAKKMAQFDALSLQVDEAYVSLETHRKLLRKLEQCVPREDLQEAVERAERLQTRLETQTVSAEEHAHLKSVLQQVVEDKRLVEEASRFFDEERHAAALSVKEAESKCSVYKNRVDSVEIELKDCLVRQEALEGAVAALKEQLISSHDETHGLTQRIIGLESDKAALLTQLGTLKIARRSEEAGIRKSAQETREMSVEIVSLHARVAALTESLDSETSKLRSQADAERRHQHESVEAMKRERDEARKARAELLASHSVLEDKLRMSEEQHKAALAELDDFRQQLMAEPLLLLLQGAEGVDDAGMSIGQSTPGSAVSVSPSAPHSRSPSPAQASTFLSTCNIYGRSSPTLSAQKQTHRHTQAQSQSLALAQGQAQAQSRSQSQPQSQPQSQSQLQSHLKVFSSRAESSPPETSAPRPPLRVSPHPGLPLPVEDLHLDSARASLYSSKP